MVAKKGAAGAGANANANTKAPQQRSILSFFRTPTPAAAAGAAAAPSGGATGNGKENEKQQQPSAPAPTPAPAAEATAPPTPAKAPEEVTAGSGSSGSGDDDNNNEPLPPSPPAPPQEPPEAAPAAAPAAAPEGMDGVAPSPAAVPPASAPDEGNEGGEDEGEGDDDDEGDGLTDFERARLERIRENQAFLASLGLQSCKPSALLRSDGADKPKPKKKKRPAPSSFAAAAAAASLPLRRSTRQRGPPLVGSYSEMEAAAAAAMEEELEPEPEEAEVDYDDSTVLKYLCSSTNGSGPMQGFLSSGGGGSKGGGSKKRSEPLKGFRAPATKGPLLCDPALSAVYSLHLQPRGSAAGAGGGPPLLAAAGKQGRIAIFNTAGGSGAGSGKKGADEDDEDDDEEGGPRGLLMSYRGHGGWVADVRFLPSASASASALLVSAGNDASIKLWDLSRVHPTTGVPRAAASLDRVHSKGVFSMDARGSLIATGSKDATVALLRLGPDGSLREDRRLEDLQDSVVKCVRFAPSPSDDPTRLALAGDDRDVKVVDLRAPSSSGGGGDGVLTIPGAHARTVHTLRWHPVEEHLLLTVGLDPHVRLWDLRKLGPSSSSKAFSSASAETEPVVAFFGHVSSLVKKQNGITPAEFYDDSDGRYVLIAGEGSQRLSVYETATGHAVSRGLLGSEVSQLVVLPSNDPDHRPSLLAAERKGAVVRMDPF